MQELLFESLTFKQLFIHNQSLTFRGTNIWKSSPKVLHGAISNVARFLLYVYQVTAEIKVLPGISDRKLMC